MRVNWNIDVESDTPEDAAQKARDAQVRNGTTATVFEVTDADGVTTTVDLGVQAIPDSLCVLMVGNPVDGMTLYGPFRNGVLANLYADEHHGGDDWWCVNIQPAD